MLADFKVPIQVEFKAIVVSANDYYPFGMVMEGRKYRDENYDYRYGFNGKEDDKDFGDKQLIQDYGFRLYNPALVRFLSVDPLAPSYPELTVYQFASNTPIWMIDIDGLEGIPSTGGAPSIQTTSVQEINRQVIPYDPKMHTEISLQNPLSSGLQLGSIKNIDGTDYSLDDVKTVIIPYIQSTPNPQTGATRRLYIPPSIRLGSGSQNQVIPLGNYDYLLRFIGNGISRTDSRYKNNNPKNPYLSTRIDGEARHILSYKEVAFKQYIITELVTQEIINPVADKLGMLGGDAKFNTGASPDVDKNFKPTGTFTDYASTALGKLASKHNLTISFSGGVVNQEVGAMNYYGYSSINALVKARVDYTRNYFSGFGVNTNFSGMNYSSSSDVQMPYSLTFPNGTTNRTFLRFSTITTTEIW